MGERNCGSRCRAADAAALVQYARRCVVVKRVADDDRHSVPWSAGRRRAMRFVTDP